MVLRRPHKATGCSESVLMVTKKCAADADRAHKEPKHPPTVCEGCCCFLLRSFTAKVAEGSGSAVITAACSDSSEVAPPIAAPVGGGSRANSKEIPLVWCSSGAPFAALLSTKLVCFAGIAAACSDGPEAMRHEDAAQREERGAHRSHSDHSRVTKRARSPC